jgi:SAM-dependent methyltransferase
VADVAGVPAENLDSFAGTGNRFAAGPILRGERVVDVGAGAGLDALIAARRVGPQGRVIGVDMTSEMVAKARAGAAAMGLQNVAFREGYAESLPAPDASADVVISNGVLNLTLDKTATLRKWLIAAGMWVQAAGILLFVIGQGFVVWMAGAVLLGLGTAVVYPTLLGRARTWRTPSGGRRRWGFAGCGATAAMPWAP